MARDNKNVLDLNPLYCEKQNASVRTFQHNHIDGNIYVDITPRIQIAFSTFDTAHGEIVIGGTLDSVPITKKGCTMCDFLHMNEVILNGRTVGVELFGLSDTAKEEGHTEEEAHAICIDIEEVRKAIPLTCPRTLSGLFANVENENDINDAIKLCIDTFKNMDGETVEADTELTDQQLETLEGYAQNCFSMLWDGETEEQEAVGAWACDVLIMDNFWHCVSARVGFFLDNDNTEISKL